MNTIDFLHLKNDWTEIKKHITKIAIQLENDGQYTKELAVRDLIHVIKEMDSNEPMIEFAKPISNQ